MSLSHSHQGVVVVVSVGLQESVPVAKINSRNNYCMDGKLSLINISPTITPPPYL